MINTKRKLLVLKHEHCLNDSIDKSDLILLINISQDELFVRVDKNRRDIIDKEQGPYNRNVFTFSQSRATMTASAYLKDIKHHADLSPSSSVSDIINDLFSEHLFP